MNDLFGIGETTLAIPENSGEIVLLIDDDTDLLRCLESYLRHGGFVIHSEYNPLSALVYYREHWQDIALVVTDVDMPWLNGFAMLWEMAKVNPQLTAVVMSGAMLAEDASVYPVDIIAFLHKPFELRQLFEQVSAGIRRTNERRQPDSQFSKANG